MQGDTPQLGWKWVPGGFVPQEPRSFRKPAAHTPRLLLLDVSWFTRVDFSLSVSWFLRVGVGG